MSSMWFANSAQIPQQQLKFFGTTFGNGSCPPEGGRECDGVLFELCPSTGVMTKIYTLPHQYESEYVTGSLTLYKRNLFGMAYVGGTYDLGYIFKWNLVYNCLTIIYECNSPDDYYPIGSMTLHNGLLYGMISDGDLPNMGVIFELNPET